MQGGARSRAVLGLVAVVVVACSGGPTTSTPPGSIGSAGPSATAAASGVADIVVGGDRPVTVHVPAGYHADQPAPLLINLHGYTGSGAEHDAYFGLGELADQRGYLYAYPDGTIDSAGDRFWNATDACCNFHGSEVDDVGYLAGLINEIRASLAVDPKRVAFIGHSNGGFMSYAMACAHADEIAAIVSLAGATFATSTDCAPTGPVAILQIHGTLDDVIAYEGGATDGPGGRIAYPGAEASVATWATYDGCTAASEIDEHVDVDAGIGTAAAPAEASVTRWAGCEPGGAAELWTIPGGGHGPNISEAFPAAVLDFFEAHPKP